jgi:hypothetical protein
MNGKRYAVTFDCRKVFEITVEAEVDGDSFLKARTDVAGLINDAFQSLEKHGVWLSVEESSGYRTLVSEFKERHFYADNIQGGE